MAPERPHTVYVEVPQRAVQVYEVQAYSLVDAEREVERFRQTGYPNDGSVQEVDNRVTWSGKGRAVRARRDAV